MKIISYDISILFLKKVNKGTRLLAFSIITAYISKCRTTTSQNSKQKNRENKFIRKEK